MSKQNLDAPIRDVPISDEAKSWTAAQELTSPSRLDLPKMSPTIPEIDDSSRRMRIDHAIKLRQFVRALIRLNTDLDSSKDELYATELETAKDLCFKSQIPYDKIRETEKLISEAIRHGTAFHNAFSVEVKGL